MATVLTLQRALQGFGLDPGPLDGMLGRLTLSALRAFQRSRGLAPSGTLDVATAAALFPGEPHAAAASLPPWHAIAEGLKGTREVAGSRHNPILMGWAEKLRLQYRSDETAWCGLFAAHCLATALPDEPLPANPLGARNFLRFGVPLEKPSLGAVLVFWRGSRSGWSGHVGFYAGESGSTLAVLGGNQSNSVCVAAIARERLIGIRWPASVPLPAAVRIPAIAPPSSTEA
jgi:uncharacterized protein (TIGR02594 family)